MTPFATIVEKAAKRHGGADALEAMLPKPKSPAALKRVADDRYLSQMSLRVFQAGLKHSMVEAKWPAFEEAFFGFVPQKVVLMGAEHLERLMGDARLIRHAGKLASVPRNAQMILEIAAEHVTESHFARGKPHCRARHRGFAEIERRAIAADPAAHHDKAILRRTQLLVSRHRDSA